MKLFHVDVSLYWNLGFILFIVCENGFFFKKPKIKVDSSNFVDSCSYKLSIFWNWNDVALRDNFKIWVFASLIYLTFKKNKINWNIFNLNTNCLYQTTMQVKVIVGASYYMNTQKCLEQQIKFFNWKGEI